MRIGLRNNPPEFHPDPIWNDGVLGPISITAARCVAWPRNATRSRNGNRPLGFLQDGRPHQEEQEQQQDE